MMTVMWTDVFQVLVICLGIVLILVIGLDKSDGFNQVLKINLLYNRMNLFKFEF